MHRQFWCLILYVSFIGSEDPQRICKILLYCFWCVFGECFWKRETFESVNWIMKTRHFQCEWVLLNPQKAMMGEGSVFSLLDLGPVLSSHIRSLGSQIFWLRPGLSYLDYTYFSHPPKHLLWWQAIAFTGSCNFTSNTS